MFPGLAGRVGRPIPVDSRVQLLVSSHNSRRAPEPAAREVLAWLEVPGCALCAEEVGSQRRFFFWYVTENYGEAPTVARVRHSLGFCARHAMRLVELAEPTSLGHIYGPVVQTGLVIVSPTPGARSSVAVARTIDLRPRSRCLPCEAEESGWRRRTAAIVRELADPSVRAAFTGGFPVWLEHLALAWPDLRDELPVWVDAVCDLLSADLSGVDMRDLRGIDLGDAQAPATASLPVPRHEGGWSRSLMELADDLSSSACPACLRCQRELATSATWLVDEVAEGPHHRWASATDLCREHSWFVQHVAGPPGLGPLREAMREQGLAEIARALSAADVPRGRQWLPSRRRPVTVPALGADRECPACRLLGESAARTCELLVRGLGSPAFETASWDSAGLCFPHLAVALRRVTTDRQADLLLTTERLRLEVLDFELAEAGRRQSWDARWEPPSAVSSSWRRAVEHMGGLLRLTGKEDV